MVARRPASQKALTGPALKRPEERLCNVYAIMHYIFGDIIMIVWLVLSYR